MYSAFRAATDDFKVNICCCCSSRSCCSCSILSSCSCSTCCFRSLICLSVTLWFLLDSRLREAGSWLVSRRLGDREVELARLGLWNSLWDSWDWSSSARGILGVPPAWEAESPCCTLGLRPGDSSPCCILGLGRGERLPCSI